ncbi:hypothetical protein [Mycobacterium phage PR]|nr:putative helix-turn-helix DNA binding domain protein [Mycobacterium phage D12]BBC28617.1 hypothetical protein [Mycobacterium phage PR]
MVSGVASERWEPDNSIVEVALSTPKSTRRMTDLSGPDRSWLVAGLTLWGMTAQEIADRLSCSLRLVRTIRAEEMTQVCYLAQEREAALTDEVRQLDMAARMLRRERDCALQEVARLRAQLDQVIDAHVTGVLETFPKCGHPKVGYNVYKRAGRSYCRTCRRDWDQANRSAATRASVTA